MSYIIAVAGKGGTGKSTISALIIRSLKEKGKVPVLAIDADPSAALGEYLGITVKETIGSIVDAIARHPDKIPAGMPKDRYLEYRIQNSIIEAEGFDLLTMGRPEGPGCYCYINNLLRGMIAKLTADYPYIVIDNEAGFEHLSRRTTRKADTLLLISDHSKVGLRSVVRINGLAKELELDIRDTALIINRSKSASLPGDIKKEFPDIKTVGNIAEDNDILKASIAGKSVFSLRPESITYQRINEIGDKIWKST